MIIGDICNRHVVAAVKTEGIVEAAKRMRSAHVGDLVVVEDRGNGPVPVGIVTDRDIVVSVVAGEPEHMEYLLVGDVMTEQVVTGREDDSLETALETMKEHGVRRLPIVDTAGVLAGIFTLDDVLPHLPTPTRELAGIVAREQERERRQRR